MMSSKKKRIIFFIFTWLLIPFFFKSDLQDGYQKFSLLSQFINVIYYAPVASFVDKPFFGWNKGLHVYWQGHLLTIIFYLSIFGLVFLTSKYVSRCDLKQRKIVFFLLFSACLLLPFVFYFFSYHSNIWFFWFILERIYYFPIFLIGEPFFQSDSELLFVITWKGRLIGMFYYTCIFYIATLIRKRFYRDRIKIAKK